MDSNKNYNFYVVDILDPLYVGYERYFCIPSSWIRVKESKRRALISFPLEEISVIKEWVKSGKEFSDNWTVLAADVKCGADSYEDASNCITKLQNRLLQERSYAEIIKEQESSMSFEPKSPVSLLNTDVEELTKPQEIVSKQTLCANLNIDISENQDGTVEISDAAKDVMKTLPQPPKDKQLTSIGPSSRRTMLKNNNPKNTLNAEDIIKLIFESEFLDEFKKELTSLERDKFKNVLIRDDCANMGAIMKNIIQLLENYKKRYINPPNVTTKEDITTINKDATEKEKGTINVDAETNHTQEKHESHDTNVVVENINNDKHDHNVQPKKHTIFKQFTLPKEYNENDSRWTLRHPEKKPGLVELLPYSKIYVDATGLRNCKRNSKNDERTLARLLLLEIFSDSALSVCSLTGRMAFSYRSEGYRQRPGLDEDARMVLLNYVHQYARKRNWPQHDECCVTGSVRNKLRDIRAELNK